MFSFKKTTNGRKILTYSATAIKRFSIIIAFWHKSAWRIRTRIVVSLTNGVIAFPLTKTLFMENGRIFAPNEYKSNTALFIGLHSPADEIKLVLRVYANANGKDIFKSDQFNGYTANIRWTRLPEEIWHSENLHSRNAKKLRFDNGLYLANGQPKKIGNFGEQRFVPEPKIAMTLPQLSHPTQNVEFSESDRHETETIESDENEGYNDFQFWRIKVNFP